MTLQDIKNRKLTVDINAPTYEAAQTVCNFFDTPSLAHHWYDNRGTTVYTIERGELTSCRAGFRTGVFKSSRLWWEDITNLPNTDITTHLLKKLNAPQLNSTFFNTFVCSNCLKAIYLPNNDFVTNIKRCPYCEKKVQFEP